jgi:hypothetical protein
LHEVERLTVQARSSGRSRNPSAPDAYSFATAACASAKRAPTSRHSASVIPPSIGGDIMFV